MEEELVVQQSLTEQILEEMFAQIERREEFNAEVFQKLKQLALGGDLTKVEEVTQAIKPGEREHHESA